jgi:hypothetical protein
VVVLVAARTSQLQPLQIQCFKVSRDHLASTPAFFVWSMLLSQYSRRKIVKTPDVCQNEAAS